MNHPQRIKIVFEAGTAEIYGDIFADILTTYYLAMSDRQKEQQKNLAQIELNFDDRLVKFKQCMFEFDDADSRQTIVEEIEKVFKGQKTSYTQPERQS